MLATRQNVITWVLDVEATFQRALQVYYEGGLHTLQKKSVKLLTNFSTLLKDVHTGSGSSGMTTYGLSEKLSHNTVFMASTREGPRSSLPSCCRMLGVETATWVHP